MQNKLIIKKPSLKTGIKHLGTCLDQLNINDRGNMLNTFYKQVYLTVEKEEYLKFIKQCFVSFREKLMSNFKMFILADTINVFCYSAAYF